MADKIKLHPETPHQKRVFEIADRLRDGEVMLFPTDTQYALGCTYNNKRGQDRIKEIRRLDDDHLFTLLCDSLTGLAKFAHINDANFKIIKRLIPAPITFILPATREVPSLIQSKRKTIGFRVPDSQICQSFIAELGEPIFATSAKLPEDSMSRMPKYSDDLFHLFDKLVDVVIDDEQPLSPANSTILDMTTETPELIRIGAHHKEIKEVLDSMNIPLKVG